MGKESRYYTEEFKRQIVELMASGKKIGDIEREYKVTRTSIRGGSKSFYIYLYVNADMMKRLMITKQYL